MQTAISSTEAVRNFSELLNNIKYRGDRYTVIRGGKPAASLVPVEPARIVATLADLRKIMRALPHLDSSDMSFEADVMAAANSQPSMPKALSWE
ncbi:MAG: type II toxin-antitoxin system Phd/YefM family antitoxin [Deltaproteobacteria bacterium]|nr:type II toxin-antitoxin system Phd/YefM family antitoxin [Deltaproteobacteria bacterium]